MYRLLAGLTIVAAIGAAYAFGGFFNVLNQGAALPQGAAVFETSLQSRISSTDTSLTLVANSVRGGSTLSGYQCFTVDEGRTDAEYICGQVSGTSVTSLERGIDPLTGTSTNSTLKFAHRVGANVKITDFPLIQRLRNMLGGTEYAPALPIATTTVLIDSNSASSTFATKYYVDTSSVAGAADANETTKGIGELATAAEAAAGTSLGSTLSRLLLPASLATSTPGLNATTQIPITVSGKLAQAFLDLTASFSPTGVWNFGANVGIGSSSPYAALSVVSARPAVFGTIYATSTATSNATSTFAGNIDVGGNATTTNLYAGGAAYLGILSTTSAAVTGPTTDANTATANAYCPSGYNALGGGVQLSGISTVYMTENYPFNSSTWRATVVCRNGGGCAANTVTATAICARIK